VALGWTARNRARVGMALAGILLLPGVATIWTAWEKFNTPTPPEPLALTLTGLGAFAVNLSCAFMLAAITAGAAASLARPSYRPATTCSPT
jgi:Co/Zn/Cd efflux system component